MTKETNNTPEEKPNDHGGGTEKPWDKSHVNPQDPASPQVTKPDLEKWNESGTH
jgi:hypothetical protein